MQRFSALASFGVGTALSLIVVETALAQAQSTGLEGNVTTNAADLIRLNPDPDPLSLPTRPEQVQIDLNQPITLQQAIELARRNNRDLQAIESQLRQSRAALRQAQAALFPTLSLQSSLTRTESATTKLFNQRAEQQFAELPPLTQSLLGQPQTSSPVSNLTSTTLQLSYNVFTFGQRDASIKAAREQVRFSELDLSRQFEQLRFTVTDDYYNIQQADAIVRIAQAAVENSQISLRDTVARERAGLGTRFDVLQAQVQLANNQQQLTQAISDQQTARRQLAQTLSVANTVNLSAADPIQVAGKWTLPLADSIVLGLRNRVELEQQIAQRNIALQQRRVALANLGPQIAVGSTLNTTDSVTDRQAPNWGYSVTGQLSLNIFEGGASSASAAQQSASVAIAETQFASFKNLIRFQIEQSFNTLQASAENIETNRVAVEQATEGLRLARLRFQAGVGTQLEVSNAETSLTRSQSNLLSATVTYNRALAALQRFVSNQPLDFPAATATTPPTTPTVSPTPTTP
ncbi:MAG: TolC family protein [Aphanocapsa sp. GSE-SYN-MK-11-07L]|jgi:OMF family outer membrane factor|nr:TolC family protein [Aphanocapsa sp. GSE-SYN-MK-11-07L]